MISMKNNFVFIGDSLTFGYGVKKEDSFVYNLKKHLSFNIINKGLNGDITVSMLERFHRDVILNNPKYIFIMGGTNDLLCGRTVSSIVENICEMVTEALTKTQNVYIGIPPCIIPEKACALFSPSEIYSYCYRKLPVLREELIKLSASKNISYIDYYKITLENLNNNIYLDGIHLNSKGNKLMLSATLNVLT